MELITLTLRRSSSPHNQLHHDTTTPTLMIFAGHSDPALPAVKACSFLPHQQDSYNRRLIHPSAQLVANHQALRSFHNIGSSRSSSTPAPDTQTSLVIAFHLPRVLRKVQYFGHLAEDYHAKISLPKLERFVEDDHLAAAVG